MLTQGPLPPKIVVRHKCDQSACLNIDCMELGSQADNMRDKVERGRSRLDVCKNGLHPLSGENVYTMPSNPEYRECRECRNERNRRYHERKKNC